MALLEENIGKIFSDINHSNIFLISKGKKKKKKAKIHKFNLIKFKSVAQQRKPAK